MVVSTIGFLRIFDQVYTMMHSAGGLLNLTGTMIYEYAFKNCLGVPPIHRNSILDPSCCQSGSTWLMNTNERCELENRATGTSAACGHPVDPAIPAVW